MLDKQLLDTARGRIVSLLRPGGITTDQIASALGVTPNAVRSQLALMERDGVIRRAGRRPGVTRPSQVFELTPEVEQLLSRAYVPLLIQLVRTLSDGLAPADVEGMMRQAGKALAEELSPGHRPAASLASRVQAASDVLNAQMGAITHVERNGRFRIRGAGCPLAALTGKHPAVCLAVESLVAEVVGVPVRECCEREGRPRCCFEIGTAPQLEERERPVDARRRRQRVQR